MTRRSLIALLLAGTTAAACSPGDTTAPGATPSASASATAATDTGAAYDLKAQYDKIAVVRIAPDTAFLNDEQRQVVNLLNQAADLMTQIYLRQRSADLPQVREAIAKSDKGDRDLLLKMFDRNLGPWDEIDDLHPFWGTKPMPAGAGFYPTDLTREQLEAYIAKHPDQKKALLSPYTVVKREGDKLIAVPYSVEYKEWLDPAAKLLEKAASITSNPSLKKFLSLRAKSFLTDDYFQSELAWMDLKDTPIEVAIGPYETYTDKLMGQKTAFEAFVTLKQPAESAALDKYKAYLRDLEGNLPIDDKYKNFKRGFASPISVAEQVHGGGDNVPGPQTIAFNLPNDERVREAKGAKKVILSNVLGAKFERILQPMGTHILVADQQPLIMKKYMQLETLFHELSHSLGPGTITLDGKQTTVGEALKEQYSAIEEAKADVMGAWNILYMMKKGEIPAAEKPQLFATFLTGTFRSMRFGTSDAHGKGAAMQYGYLRAAGAFSWDEKEKRFRVDNDKMEAGLKNLLHDMLMLQATGDYEGTKALFAKWANLDPQAKEVLATTKDIPVDIQPVYPDKI